MLGYQWTEKVEVSRENCRQLLERIGLENWALGNTKVNVYTVTLGRLSSRLK